MDRDECHKELDRLLDLISHAPSDADEKKTAEYAARVSEASIRFLDWIAGDCIAHQIYAGGHSPLHNESTGSCAETFNKRGLSVAIDMFSLIFQKAKLAVPHIQRDLLQMSLKGGSEPLLLTLPKRSKGKKKHRDLKARARARICEAVYQENGRTGENITSIRNRLRNTENEADRKAWDRMVKEFPKGKRKQEIQKGKAFKEASNDIHPEAFRVLWQWAMLK